MARVAGRAFYDSRNRSAKGFQYWMVHIADEYPGNFAEHFVSGIFPCGHKQRVAILEVLVEVPVVQRRPGTDAPHRHCSPTAFAPDLGRCVDQPLPTFGAAFLGGTTAPRSRCYPHISILTRRPRNRKLMACADNGGMRHQDGWGRRSESVCCSKSAPTRTGRQCRSLR